MSLSPTSVAYSAPLGRWTLTSFALAIQGDPLAKRPTKVTGASAQPDGYGAPEMSDEVPYDPFACDLYALGRILSSVAAVRLRLRGLCQFASADFCSRYWFCSHRE